VVALEELQLVIIGALFALGVALTAYLLRRLVLRVAGDASLVILAAVALHMLKLTIDGDPMDLMSVDFGIILMLGTCGIGGLLPRQLRDLK
jgi:hypothetical protein